MAFRIAVLCCSVLVASVSVQSQSQEDVFIAEIVSAPSVYRTPEARSFFELKHGGSSYVAPLDEEEKKRARAALFAAVKLGEMGVNTAPAIDALVRTFPQAIHVMSITDTYTYQPGEGSFSDWVNTRATGIKNAFMLKPPFLSAQLIGNCEPFLDTRTEQNSTGVRRSASGGVLQAQTTINVIFTFHAAACALTKITGQSHGDSQRQWQLWWNQVRTSSYNTPIANQRPAHDFDPHAEFQQGAKFQVTLKTGRVLSGTIEGIDEKTVIIETDQGDAYQFEKQLVESKIMTAPAATPEKKSQTTAQSTSHIITFNELQNQKITDAVLRVKLKSGGTFTGKLHSIDANMLQLSVDGSIIPMSKEVIYQIVIGGPESQKESKKTTSTTPKTNRPQDTVIVQNNQVDDWGNRGDPIHVIGKITSESNASVQLVTPSGERRELPRAQILRIIKHSRSSYEQNITRYAKPLLCKDGMKMVDVPPGTEGRPFFKVCIDQYEAPNTKGSKPNTNVSFEDARKNCEALGKRLCTEFEWEYGCSGLEGYTYAYGWNFDPDICNSEGIEDLQPSGAYRNCVSKYGLFDMTGNIFEWVVSESGNPLLMGGPLSKCQTRSPGVGGSAKPQIGYRCCDSN